jgi:dephospho-CoA kinase
MDRSGNARYRGQFRPQFSRLHHDRDLFWVVPFPIRYVMAVTGERFSGKTTALTYLSEKKGFEVYSLATDLREMAGHRGVPLEPRTQLQDFGDELRAEYDDPGILGRIMMRRIHREHLSHRPMAEPTRRIAVGGFKRPEELEIFERTPSFVQIAVQCDSALRFKRSQQSGVLGRELSHLTLSGPVDALAFAEHIDERDLRGRPNRWTGAYGQRVAEVIARPSAIALSNAGNVADLYKQLDELVARYDDEFRTAPQ